MKTYVITFFLFKIIANICRSRETQEVRAKSMSSFSNIEIIQLSYQSG